MPMLERRMNAKEPNRCADMTVAEFLGRTVEILAEESGEPVAWWWLSFCDPERPAGTQFLGACLVRARGFFSATHIARDRGCNPGGECQGLGPIPDDKPIAPRWTYRLLTKAECEEMDREMGAGS